MRLATLFMATRICEACSVRLEVLPGSLKSPKASKNWDASPANNFNTTKVEVLKAMPSVGGGEADAPNIAATDDELS